MELEGSLLCYNNLPLVLVLSQINPIHSFVFFFIKLYFSVNHILSKYCIKRVLLGALL